MSTSPGRLHLWPALLALLSVALIVAALDLAVRRRLPMELGRLAGTMAPVKLTGNVLQTAAFRTPGVLPIYGSSELDKPAENRPDAFFALRPTGFSVFPIGKAGNTCLILLEKLAAAGPAVRGKKVAVFLSPSWFLRDASADAVEGSLRPVQVGRWIYGSGLSAGLRRDIARRLAAFPRLFLHQPLLEEGLRCLVDDSAWSRLQLALLTPLGRAQNFLLERAENWAIFRETSTALSTHRQHIHEQRRTDLPAPKGPPDWATLAAAGEAHDRALGDTSPFSIGAPTRDEKRFPPEFSHPDQPDFLEPADTDEAPSPAGTKDADFSAKLAASREWHDLSLLLRTLRELDADALIICQPFNGRYRDAGGNTPRARRAFYDKLEQAVRRAGYPVRDFSEHEEDRTFFSDSGHPSAKAWVFYDEALDAFYHSPDGGSSAATRLEGGRLSR